MNIEATVTPKVFANFSPGLLQPWVNILNEKPNSERVRQLSPNIRQHLRRYIVPMLLDPRVEATLGCN